MSRRFRFVLIVALVLVASAIATQGCLDREAGKALPASLAARERQETLDRAAIRRRDPRISPAADGDAATFYEAIAAERPPELAPSAAAEAVARVLAAAHQPLTVAAGADIEHLDRSAAQDAGPLLELPSSPHLATWAASFVGVSLRYTVANDPGAGLRAATAGLLVAWDGLEFGRIDQAKKFLSVAADNLVAARKAIATGVPDVAALLEFGYIVEALASRPLPTRDAAWAFATAEAQAAGAASAEGTWESPKRARPGLSWLWSEAIARKEAVDWVAHEAAAVLRICDSPAASLRAACEAARERCAKNVNPYLYLVLHAPGETIRWKPEPVVKSAALLEARRAWHERLALARAAAAIARFAAEHRALPTGLIDLVPTFSADVPLDPTSERRLGYQNGLLWAVGPDGDDDDARPIDDVAMVEEMPDGDVVWRIAVPVVKR